SNKGSWRSNVAMNTIKQYKKLDVTFDMTEIGWQVQRKGPTIISKLNDKLKKQSKQTHTKLGLFFIEQFLDPSSRILLTWQQVKTACGRNNKGKTSYWFHRLEELLIDGAEDHKVKEDPCSSAINTLALQLCDSNVLPDNRYKQWIWFAHKDKGGWLIGRVNKLLEKTVHIEHWIEECTQVNKSLEHIWFELKAQAKMRQERITARQDYVRGLVKQKTIESLRALLTSSKETREAFKALIHMYQEGFYRKEEKRYGRGAAHQRKDTQEP
ncbi:4757_t:CDS:2, partial [Gigaspora rosea]